MTRVYLLHDAKSYEVDDSMLFCTGGILKLDLGDGRIVPVSYKTQNGQRILKEIELVRREQPTQIEAYGELA